MYPLETLFDELDVFVLDVVSNNLSLIDGTPKQVPITTLHPNTPLTKGTKKPLAKPILDLFFFSGS